MNLKQLIERFRQQSGDRANPPLWSDEEVTGFYNEAVEQAAVRARLINDRTTVAITQLPLLAGIRAYNLHPSIIDIESISYTRPDGNGRHWPLMRVDRDELDWWHHHNPNATGWPDRFHVYEDGGGNEVTGYRSFRLSFERTILTAGGIAHLSVYRLPLAPMEDPDDEPEIHYRHHDGLVDWALYRAYNTRDIEGDAPQRAATAEIRFERRFGELFDANVQRKHAKHRPTIVRPNTW